MSQMKSQKVFVQYMYCPLCRSNHKRGKKHVMTEKHQEIVANVLKKFSKKIAEAKNSAEEPIVKDMLWPDVNRKFWCYFCQSDVDRHKVNQIEAGDSIVVVHGGMMEHIVREDHITSTTTFLKNNRVDMKRTADFVLTSQAYVKFLGNVEKAIAVFFRDKSHVLKQMSSHIRAQMAIQKQITAAALLDQSRQLQEKHRFRQDMAHTNTRLISSEDGERRKTAQAFGQGLTAVDRSNEDDSLGNIYTNAVPPWMMPNTEDAEDSSEIGPTIKDLEQHRKLERKAKLPATRVGAKFDRKADQSDSWMPSFGGVWHHSRRTDSVKHFNRRQIGKHKLPLPTASHPPSQRGSNHPPGESFVYPPNLEPGHSENAPVNKVPRTTSTAHSPWNSYVSCTRATTFQSQPFTAPSDFKIQTVTGDHSSTSSSHLHSAQPYSSSGSLQTPDLHSARLSVRPYVSKRRNQNSSISSISRPGPSATDYFSLPNTSYPPPHSSILIKHQGLATATPYPSQYPDSHSQEAAWVGKSLVNQHFDNGYVNYRESSSKSNQPSKAPIRTTASEQQPVRLLSTPLLQNKKDKR